jgi:hypothetical protein
MHQFTGSLRPQGISWRLMRDMPYNGFMEEFAPPRSISDILKERNIELVGADPATQLGFTQVPNFILTKGDISVGAKLAYAMLLKYAWGDSACYPGQANLQRTWERVSAASDATLKSSKRPAFWISSSAALRRLTSTGFFSLYSGRYRDAR